MLAYLLLVGIPVLGLFGILEAGRGMAAPPSIGGEWYVQLEAPDGCAVSRLRQPAMSIAQSGTQALITLNDGRGTMIQAKLHDGTLSNRLLTAAVRGGPGDRVLEGRFRMDGCSAAAFRAVRRRPPGKRGE